MALSQTPPPLFTQGLPARLRLLIAVFLAAGTLYVDLNLGLLKPLRQGLSMVLYPIEQVLMMPRDVFYWFTKYGTVIIDTVDRLRERLPQLEASLPGSMSLSVVMDRTPVIRASVQQSKRAP